MGCLRRSAGGIRISHRSSSGVSTRRRSTHPCSYHCPHIPFVLFLLLFRLLQNLPMNLCISTGIPRLDRRYQSNTVVRIILLIFRASASHAISATASHELFATASHAISATASHELFATASHELFATASHAISATASHAISATAISHCVSESPCSR